MVYQIIFKGITCQVKESIKRLLQRCLNEHSQRIALNMEVFFENSYDCTSIDLRRQQITKQGNMRVQFQKQIIFLSEGRKGVIIFSFHLQKKTIYTFTKQIAIEGQNTLSEYYITNNQNQQLFRIKYSYQIADKSILPFIILKNINCELKNNISAENNKKYISLGEGNKKYRNNPLNILYWQTPVKIYIEKQAIIHLSLVDEQSEEKINITPQKIQSFTLQKGFKRIFIVNQIEQPRGCIQFYYETYGLRTQEQYQRLAELQLNNQKQILKLNINTIKAKFKQDHKQIAVRAFSGLNYILTEEDKNESKQFAFTINKHIYIEPTQSKCNFIVYSRNEAIGYGTLLLNIVGVFERRVGIISTSTRKQLGYLTMSIKSQKQTASCIQLANLRLNLGEIFIDKLLFLSFIMPGSYTRTELKKAQNQTIDFKRLILMKYVNQQDLQIVLSDSNNCQYCRIQTKIQKFKGNPLQPVSKKLFCIDPLKKLNLQFNYISGDLNKFNLSMVENRGVDMSKAVQIPSLIEVRKNKQRLTLKMKQSLTQELQQFQKSLVNHIQKRQFRISNSLKSRNRIKLNDKQKNQGNLLFKIMYSSKPQAKLNYSLPKSPQKQVINLSSYINPTNKRSSSPFGIHLPTLKKDQFETKSIFLPKIKLPQKCQSLK